MPSSVVKMLNSGAPGVMLDLEDSMANTWDHLMLGHRQHRRGALRRAHLRRCQARREPSRSLRAIRCLEPRARAASLASRRDLGDAATSASLFDLALLAFRVDASACNIRSASTFRNRSRPRKRSGGATSSTRWSKAKSWEPGAIKAMALVESHPLAYEMEEFVFNLRDYIVGLNLGRWDYMASLIHFNLERSAVAAARSQHDSDRRAVLPELAHAAARRSAHKHGALAIGGMTALYPSREDPELNARALDRARARQEERSRVPDGRRVDRPSRSKRDRGRAVSRSESTRRASGARNACIPILRPAPRGVGSDDARRYARRGPHRHSLSPRRARTGAARACSTATWKISRPIASIV